MNRIKIRFEHGDMLTAYLLEEKAPQTCNIIWESLPHESVITHSRWSGREVNFVYKATPFPVRENQTIYTSKGEIVYWRDWNWEGTGEPPQAIAIYYGAEEARSNKGYEPVNVFAQVEYKYLHKLEKIGERIWLNGKEKVYFERL